MAIRPSLFTRSRRGPVSRGSTSMEELGVSELLLLRSEAAEELPPSPEMTAGTRLFRNSITDIRYVLVRRTALTTLTHNTLQCVRRGGGVKLGMDPTGTRTVRSQHLLVLPQGPSPWRPLQPTSLQPTAAGPRFSSTPLLLL